MGARKMYGVLSDTDEFDEACKSVYGANESNALLGNDDNWVDCFFASRNLGSQFDQLVQVLDQTKLDKSSCMVVAEAVAI
ncbi:hypothetical protein GGF37_003821, partial [Kickxella alabastrina]